jgi:hypothetical protein
LFVGGFGSLVVVGLALAVSSARSGDGLPRGTFGLAAWAVVLGIGAARQLAAVVRTASAPAHLVQLHLIATSPGHRWYRVGTEEDRLGVVGATDRDGVTPGEWWVRSGPGGHRTLQSGSRVVVVRSDHQPPGHAVLVDDA